VDEARQPDNGIDSAYRYAVAACQRGDRHQTHGDLLKNIAVVERGRRFDAVIPGLVVDGFIQVLAACVIRQLQPFQTGARTDPQRGCHSAAFAVQHFQNVCHRRGHAVDVEFKIAMRRFDPAAVQQCQRRVEYRTHVVQSSTQHVAAVDVLRISRMHSFQHSMVLGGG